MTSIGISSSTARLLHSGIHHVNLASFVHGPNSAPLPRSAAFSRRWQITPRTNSRPPPFSSPGVAIPWPSNFVLPKILSIWNDDWGLLDRLARTERVYAYPEFAQPADVVTDESLLLLLGERGGLAIAVWLSGPQDVVNQL